MNYEKKYLEALEKARQFSEHPLQEDSSSIVEYIFPELKESKDERIRKELITHCRNTRCVTEEGAERIAKWIAWLEKQGTSYTKRDVDDAFVEGMAFAKDELEKQGEQTINQPDIEIPFGAKDSELIEESYYIPKGYHAEISKDKVTIKKGGQEPTWSEKDEAGLCNALWAIKQAKKIAKDENDMGNLWYAEDWLYSLKQRIKEKQEPIAFNWSTDDKNKLLIIEQILNCAGLLINSHELTEMKNWLKSLKQRIGG